MRVREVAKTLAMMLPPVRRVLVERDDLRRKCGTLLQERDAWLSAADATLRDEPDVVRDRLDASWRAQIANLHPFDAALMRERSKTRISRFSPRYPFAQGRGPAAGQLFPQDPNNQFGHEPELAQLIELLVPDDGIFLDVGSNYGYFSIFLADRPNFRGHIHAFEPVKRSFTALRELVDTLKYSEFITCHQAAASDAMGTAKIQVFENTGEATLGDGNLTEGETVEKITLDSLNLDRVDFMKVDVEGHEPYALRGAHNIIETFKPFIFLESWTYEDEPKKTFESFEILIDLGYRMYLPCWAQSNGKFHVGVGPSHEMHTFALVPFLPADRLWFMNNPINTFAAPISREMELGELWSGSVVRANFDTIQLPRAPLNGSS